MRALGSHLAHHKITSKDYYDMFFKKEGEGICKVCGKPTLLRSIADGYNPYCSIKCKSSDKDLAEKIKCTNLKKYGVTATFCTPETHKKAVAASCTKETIEKRKNTMLKKYGTTGTFGIPVVKEKLWNEETTKKRKNTCVKKYGVTTTLALEKTKSAQKSKTSREKAAKTRHKNNMKKYGYKEVFAVPKIREKALKTKRENNTFSTSHSEDQVFEILSKKYNNVLRNFKCKQYPFLCDFFIPSQSLFIECNFHWTHGGHWFDENNKEDIEKLKKWKNKSKTSKFYEVAIKTWTQRDQIKKEVAQDNNLNYLVFWSLEEAIQYLNK